MHENYLKQALMLAQTRKGFTSPNPSVGALLVRNAKIIAEGVHERAGEAHAEVSAINSADNANDATLYVTLEPCCHQGKTPPCTEAIINAKIKTVVYGYTDPNPIVRGQGIQQLEQAGIKCIHLPLDAINQFYESYTHWVLKKRPLVTAKLALSLDGKIAHAGATPARITSAETNEKTHYFRQASDAILTTVKTIINDDPQLNVRLNDTTTRKNIYVLDSYLNFPANAQLNTTAEKITLFYCKANERRIEEIQSKGIQCIKVKTDEYGLHLNDVLARIGKDGVHDLWLEAGGVCFNAFAEQKLIHKAIIYVAPIVLGSDALDGFIGIENIFSPAKHCEWSSLGHDAICEIRMK